MSKRKTVVLGVTGSIAAYKACDITRRLMEQGCDVFPVLTKSAQKFVTSLTFSRLSGQRVSEDLFATPDENWKAQHIALAQKADVVLIAPATANVIAKIAHGIADDLLTCVVLATKKTVVIAPAMNTDMYTNLIFQENCEKLKRMGMVFVEAAEGNLACGTTGKGHLADIDLIIERTMSVV